MTNPKQDGRAFTAGERVWRHPVGIPSDMPTAHRPISGLVLAVVDEPKYGLRYYVVRWWVPTKRSYSVVLIDEIAAKYPRNIRKTREAPDGA